MTGSRKPVSAAYKLHYEVLETISFARYPGLYVSGNLSWGSHKDRIVNANENPGFVKRKIKTKIPAVREPAYNTLVRPQLDYAETIFDAHHLDKIHQTEKFQRRAACWIPCYFDRKSSISTMIETSCRRTLEQRRVYARLCLFYIIVYNMIAVPLPNYVTPNP